MSVGLVEGGRTLAGRVELVTAASSGGFSKAVAAGWEGGRSLDKEGALTLPLVTSLATNGGAGVLPMR